MNYKIALLDGPAGHELRSWVVTPPVVVGRCPTADIVIDDPSISRRHCQFLINPHGSLVVRDLDSRNGLYLDEQPVTKAVVRPGSTVRVGLLTLRVDLTDDELDNLTDEHELPTYDLADTERVEIYRTSKSGTS